MRPSGRLIALAFAGGALGTLARYGIGMAADWVLAVVLVNLLGAAFLGMVNGLGSKPGNHFSTDGARTFWGVGFAGGFTTMSGLAGVFVALNLVGLTVLSAVFMVGQLVLGVLVYLAALKLATGKPAAPNAGQAE